MENTKKKPEIQKITLVQSLGIIEEAVNVEGLS